MKKRTCPYNTSQDGVCGCPDFWKIGRRRRTIVDAKMPATPSSPTKSSLPPKTSTHTVGFPIFTPVGPPKETCFFWYHGQCRCVRGCQFEHQSHITWPIVPPPGYMHFGACRLPLCPLRGDLVAMQQAKTKDNMERQLGGQVDGAGWSRVAAAEADIREVTGTEIGDEDEVAPSRAVSVYSDSDIEFYHAVEEVVVTDTPKLASASADIPESSTAHSPRLPSNNLDDFNMSEAASTSIGLESGDEPGSSLTNPGTLGKRRRSDSPERQNEVSKRPKREPTPDLSPFVSVLERRHRIRMSHWDLKLVQPKRAVAQLHANPDHDPLSKLTKAPANSSWQPYKPPPFEPPRGPRALHCTGAMCCHYKHKGHCRLRRRNGGQIQCVYTHKLDTPLQLPETAQLQSNVNVRKSPKVLVNYELPEGEVRLEWDTDLVRRTFGEIE